MKLIVAKLLSMLHMRPVTIDYIQEVLAVLTEMINKIEAEQIKKAERSEEMAKLYMDRVAEHNSEAVRAAKLAKNIGKATS